MMPKAKPPLVPLHQLEPGQSGDFFAILAEKTLKQTRDGKSFYDCKFRDRHRSASYAAWSDSVFFDTCKDWQPGQFFKVRGLYSEHERYGPKIDVIQIRPVTEADRADGFRESDATEYSQFDPEAMFVELCELVAREIQNEPLQHLVLGLLDDHGSNLKQLPASAGRYYPFPGGWLEHTISVTRTALMLADWYIARFPNLSPALNRDLVAAGAVLHDLGRLHELAPGLPGAIIEQSIPGHLLGHLVLGRDLIRERGREIVGLDPELLLLLEHVVLTHLTKPEWGSPKLPAIPEVLILHNADDLDAKFEMFARCLSHDQSTGPFTEPDAVLKRPLLKSRNV